MTYTLFIRWESGKFRTYLKWSVIFFSQSVVNNLFTICWKVCAVTFSSVLKGNNLPSLLVELHIFHTQILHLSASFHSSFRHLRLFSFPEKLFFLLRLSSCRGSCPLFLILDSWIITGISPVFLYRASILSRHTLRLFSLGYLIGIDIICNLYRIYF